MTGLIRSQPVGIIGGGTCTPDQYEVAYRVAAGLAKKGLPILCGGRGGVMEAACKGAHDVGGTAIALLPGSDPAEANPYATLVLPTGLGNRDQAVAAGRADFSRNRIIAMASVCLVAVGGARGTANEIKLALRFGKTVFGLAGAPDPEDGDGFDESFVRRHFRRLDAPDEAVEAVMKLAGL